MPRRIEIWFVVYDDRFYLFAKTADAAGWVKNIRANPDVVVHIGERQITATARVLDRKTDRELWRQVAAIAASMDGATGRLSKSPRYPPSSAHPDLTINQPIAKLTVRAPA